MGACVKELEAITGGALGGWLARFKSDGRSSHAPPPPGTRCENCETELVGHFCHACGQEASNHHKSILHVTWEAIEGMFHLDGRLWRTVPWLFVRPGRLTREYLDGKRARHVPPFRLFLVALLLFILSAETVIHKSMHDAQHGAGHGVQAQPQAQAQAEAGHGEHGKPAAQAGHDKSAKADATAQAVPGQVASELRDSLKKDGVLTDKPGADGKQQFVESDSDSTAAEKARNEWLNTQLGKAIATPGYFMVVVFGWGHRLAVLMLPILALALGACYFYRRKFFMYDHLIVSMNYLSFVFLLWALVFVLPKPVKDIAILAALIWAPVNLFATLRGVYGSSVFGAVVKTGFVWFTTQTAFLLLLLGLLWLGLSQI